MGCTSTMVVESRKLISIPPDIINSYIDKFPAIILQKIRQKFQAIADKQTKQINHFGFLKLYSQAKLNPEMTKRLFGYFNDNQRTNIKFRQFMVKYAILTKSQQHVFFKIMFQIYKNNHEHETMSEEEYNNFQNSEAGHFKIDTTPILFPITYQTFGQILSQAQFETADYQSKLQITTQQDFPFQTISKELTDCDFNDFVPGRQYYLLSSAWYYRWSFYYQDSSQTLERSHMKSTKMLLSDNQSLGKRRRKRESSIHESNRSIQTLNKSDIGSSLIQQPSTIDFDQIQGQYKGELKESLKISTQIKIVSDTLWKLLRSLLPAEHEFKRKALNQESLQYYPKAIYYCESDSSGHFKLNTQQIRYQSVSFKVGKFLQKFASISNAGVFSKNFGQKNWREVDNNKVLAEVSLDPRFLIVVAENRQKFISKQFRKQITHQNLQLGDKVYAHFTYQKTHSDAFIIELIDENIFKIHFKGESYRYEIEVKREDITIIESQAALTSAKKKHQSVIKGIANIGNTCFINSVLECLIATPVLDQFLLQYPFHQKNNPVGYGLSQIAKCLLKNEKANPHEFKKLVDVHMSIFSGYDQHDAQQFLNLLLDKISDQMKDKPTVIDYLFGGKAQSKLTCIGCNKVKKIDQNMYILSLPIPEAEYNIYSVIIVPITSNSMKKIIFKLHKSATISEYVNVFEQRTGYSKKDYIFCQSNYNSLRKLKNEITSPAYQKKKIVDVGVVPNISLLAFEKIPTRYYYDLLKEKNDDSYKDYQVTAEMNVWTVCKIVSGKEKDKNKQISVEYVNQDNDIEKGKIEKDIYDDVTAKLGSKVTDPSYKKIMLRKYNATLKKLQNFGIQFLVGIPRWASYNDIISLTEKYISNIKSKKAKAFSKNEKGDYIIRLLDPSKLRCIFCLKQNNMFNLQEQDLCQCCEVLEKDIPLSWSARHRNFWLYIDWVDFQHCNTSFYSSLDIDALSKNVQQLQQEQQISLQECLKLHNQQEKVEMQCDSCKNKFQNLQHLIGSMPNILALHMKQFRYTSEGHLIKLDLRLKWQQFLDTSKYPLCNQGKLYELYALVRHSGNSQSGHYTCMAKRKHPFQNKRVWINFDDQMTDIVKQQQQYIDDAYLLFYKKVDMPTSSLVIYSDLNSSM